MMTELYLAGEPYHGLRPAHVTLGRLALNQPDVARAEAHLEAALKLGDAEVEVLCLLAAAVERQGRTAEALDLYQRAIRLDPERAQAAAKRAGLRVPQPNR
jgi:Flp pilus assembly protein TadD